MPKPSPFTLKKRTLPGMCPVARCHKCTGKKKKYCDNHHKMAWRLGNPARAKFDNLRTHARARGRRFTITFADFLAVTDLQTYVDSSGTTKHCYSIDRIKNELGYTPGNLRVIPIGENSAKSHFDKAAYVQAKKDAWDLVALSGNLPHGCNNDDPF